MSKARYQRNATSVAIESEARYMSRLDKEETTKIDEVAFSCEAGDIVNVTRSTRRGGFEGKEAEIIHKNERIVVVQYRNGAKESFTKGDIVTGEVRFDVVKPREGRLSKEQQEEIMVMVKAGDNRKSIAEAFGISINAVNYYARKAGVAKPRRKKPEQTEKPEKEDKTTEVKEPQKSKPERPAEEVMADECQMCLSRHVCKYKPERPGLPEWAKCRHRL